MTESVNRRRAYDSPRRRQQAQATRQLVLDAAASLFTGGGYAATTIDGIARRANVSSETVYAIFGSKRVLLAELVDVSIAGGSDAAPVLEQAWVQELRSKPDPASRLRILARHGRQILERRAAIDDVVRGAAAADPEIAALWESGKADRLAGQREVLRMVMGTSALRSGLDLETATDILYAIGSPETYQHLVIDRGWSRTRFEAWYGETLERLLLPDEGGGTR